VFAHFVAGEDAAEIAPKLQQLHGVGVGGILDYAAEADLSSPPATPDVNQPSRVYTYESEEKCDANLAVFLEAVDAVHATTPEGFAAVKVTALGDPQLLERASTALVQLRAFFETLDPAGTGVLSREAFIAGWREAFDVADDESAAAFESIDTDASGDVDIIEFLNAMPLEAVGPLVQRCRSRGPLFHSALDADECGALERMLGRLDAIAAHAKALGVVRLQIPTLIRGAIVLTPTTLPISAADDRRGAHLLPARDRPRRPPPLARAQHVVPLRVRHLPGVPRIVQRSSVLRDASNLHSFSTASSRSCNARSGTPRLRRIHDEVVRRSSWSVEALEVGIALAAN
jgi:hypothetical protein